MQAEQFYLSSTEAAISLVLVTTTEFENPELFSAEERQCMLVHQFKAKYGESCVVASGNQIHKVFVGAGDGNQTLALAQTVNRLPAGNYHAVTSLSSFARLSWSLAQYRFDRYKKCDNQPRRLVIESATYSELLIEAQAIFMVRDLINTPTNDMGPADLAEKLENLAKQHDGIFEQWIGDDLLRDNFPAIHAVGRASVSAPRLLSLTWGNPKHPTISLIGKGVCFDSGGLDLKTSGNMRLMKKDMGGAAQVIGLAHWLMAKHLPIYLQVLIPAVENAIGADAYRPGDILTMRNGLTVEIENTDAEGRLVIADAMVKACEEDPELIIDFTTLTGAARIAVGTEISAMFSNDDTVAAAILESAQSVNDPVWQLPLFAGYAGMLESSIADLSNSPSSSYAGAITAGLFLQHFISDNIPWVHFDVMAWNISNKPGKPEGGEAMGIRAVANYLEKRYTHALSS